MAFFGFGRREKIKKPLTDPLGDSRDIAELPPLDSSFNNNNFLEDKGMPKTPSINQNSDSMGRFSMPEFYPESEQKSSTFQRYSGSVQQPQQQSITKDIELISSKLDYLKVVMDNLNQRLANLENLMRVEQEQKYRW